MKIARHYNTVFFVAFILTMVVLVAQPACTSASTVVTMNPSKDNTIFSSPTGNSNGQGQIFVGRNDGSRIRRGLVAFDISEVPMGATIEMVSLRMYIDKTKVGSQTIQLRRVEADWGEGTSSTDNGDGTAAKTGDATWLRRFYNTTSWTKAGGDYSSTVSASASAGSTGTYVTWNSTPQMVADVQSWLDNPANNFGWLLLGNEAQRSSKRFLSGETSNVDQRPRLAIMYSEAVPEPSALVMLVGLACLLIPRRNAK